LSSPADAPGLLVGKACRGHLSARKHGIVAIGLAGVGAVNGHIALQLLGQRCIALRIGGHGIIHGDDMHLPAHLGEILDKLEPTLHACTTAGRPIVGDDKQLIHPQQRKG
jgi:hypothetical protein